MSPERKGLFADSAGRSGIIDHMAQGVVQGVGSEPQTKAPIHGRSDAYSSTLHIVWDDDGR